MSSVAPCLEFCSDDKSRQTALLMELSPLSNNTQPSPKDSGVDVSSPSRRDEDTFFGSPQIPQAVSSASKRSVSIKNFGSNCTVGMLETSTDMLNSSGLSSSLNTAIASSPSVCSLQTGSKKSDGKACSKTSKFYSRDRKKNFNIGEFQAKEFRKIIMSDSKDKKKKCTSASKSSSSNGKTLNGHQVGFLGAALKKTPQDSHKNYAVIPIEEKKVGIVIRVNKPFSNLETKKRKISVDKLDSKKFSPDNSLACLDQDRFEVDRSSNMSPTMPELHKETPFDEDKYPVEDRRSTRSKANHKANGEILQTVRRSNLRSATRTTPKCLLEENAGTEKCPLLPVISAIESSDESSATHYLPKKITCKLAGNVIVKTLTPNNQVRAKSRQKSKKCDGHKSTPKESHDYLQVKSISGLKIKLTKPKSHVSEIISEEHEGAKLSDFSTQSDGHLNPVCVSQATKTSSNSVDSLIPYKLVSNFSVSSPVASPVQFCSSACQHPVSVCEESAGSTNFTESMSKHFLTNRNGSGKGGFHLEEDEDGKVKLTQEKEVVMPDGKRKKLKLKMFVPSAIISPTRVDDKESNSIERLSRPCNQPADAALTFCSSDSLSPKSKFCVSPPGWQVEQNSCKFPSLNYNMFNVPTLSTEGNLDYPLAYPVSNNFLSQCTSQNSLQFSGDAAEIQSNRNGNFGSNSMAVTLGSPGSCHDASLLHLDYLGSSSQLKEHRLLKNHSCEPSNSCVVSSRMTTNPILIGHPEVSSLQEQKFSSTSHEEDSKCNSIITSNPSVALNKSRHDVPSEMIGIPRKGSLYSYCTNSSSVAPLPNNSQPTGSYKNLSSVLATTHLKEFNSLECHSNGSASIKPTGDEFEDYGEMPTLEKNEIVGQTYDFDQCNKNNSVIAKSDVDNKALLEDSQTKILEKDNIEEKSVKKTFKFDGLELEYSVDDISKPEEGCITARCLRKRSKEEKEEPEKIDKPKRKRGASRSNAKKIKGLTVASVLETSLPRDEQLGHLSHISTDTSLMSPMTHLSSMDNKPENAVFSKIMLSQSFDFSTPPPSDASCPLGEFAFSSLDDVKSSSLGSSTVSSKLIEQPVCSGSVTHSSFLLAYSSTMVVSSTSTISSSSAAFHCPTLPWSQSSIVSPKSHATSENLNSTFLSSVGQSRRLDLPVISSHRSPLSSIYTTHLSADIQLSCSNNNVQTIFGPDHFGATTPLSPSPPPPPPKFVRSFKEVDTSSVLVSSSPRHSITSVSILPSTAQSSIDTSFNGSSPLSSCTPSQCDTSKFSGESKNDRFMTQGLKSPLQESNSILSGSYPFVPPAIACCNSRDKLALFEEKSMRLHRISQRLQANSANFIKNSKAQNDDKLQNVPEKLDIANPIEPESKTCPEKKAEEEEESKRKLLDEKLKEYYLNNEEEIADYIVDQVQLVKLRNKAYRLFCCLFPEVQMPLRLSPDSEAVDQLLKTAVNMLEEKECKDIKLDDMVTPPSEEKTLDISVSCQSSSSQQSKTECQPQPRVILCYQPQKCLLHLQGLVRQFLCLVLPHLDAYLSSDASLSVMDKIVDRVVLANCAFIGLSSTNGQSHSTAAEDQSSVGEARDLANPEEPIR